MGKNLLISNDRYLNNHPILPPHLLYGQVHGVYLAGAKAHV